GKFTAERHGEAPAAIRGLPRWAGLRRGAAGRGAARPARRIAAVSFAPGCTASAATKPALPGLALPGLGLPAGAAGPQSPAPAAVCGALAWAPAPCSP